MIPVLDLKPLFDGADGIRQIAAQLEQIYSTTGFAQVINHGVPEQIIQGLYQASRNFHQLPEHEKLKLRFRQSLRGYIPMNASTLVKSELGVAKLPNQSESFMLLCDMPKQHSWYDSCMGGEQLWPDQLPAFRDQVLQYCTAMQQLAHQLMQAFSVAMHMPPDALEPCFSRPFVSLRLLRYPPRPDNAPPELYGSAPHTDYGCLTLLHQDNMGGLQVQQSEGLWEDVEPMDNALVLNTGQMMGIWSNGRLKATRHRVINRGNDYRYSMPLFYDCNIDAKVAPLSGCISAEYPVRHEPVIFGENLVKFVAANYQFI